MKKRYTAFTLAEVLITLGIIGVVAAMTIPTLMNTIEEHVLINQFKKVYSELSQAYISAANENGTANNWADTVTIHKNLKPYLKIIKECEWDGGYCPISSAPTKDLKGQLITGETPYYIMLADGAFINYHFDGSVREARVDTNGLRGPNQWGYDKFILEFAQKNGAPIITWPYYTGDGSGWIENSSSTCNKADTSNGVSEWTGGGCSYWLIKHGNMDYLHRNISDAEWTK